MAIKKGDFIEMDFTGRIADSGKIFDTTDEELAKESQIYQPNADYNPVKIVVGEQHVVPGLDTALEGKKPGKFKIKVEMEDAFGKKKSDLLKIIPSREFKKQGIKPFVGMEANIDGTPGTVRTVSGGRIIVDFNHPLAGKDLEYEVDVKKIIEDEQGKLEAVLQLMGLRYDEAEIKEGKGKVKLPHKLPEQAVESIQKEMKNLAGIEVEFDMPDE